MKIEVEFTKAYANKKKGDKGTYDSMLAAALIGKHKVAKQVKAKKKVTKNPKIEE